LLFQVSTRDPATFVAVVALMILVAGSACLVPARQASKADPMAALRSE
jgi:putative ABC transport system permease protein